MAGTAKTTPPSTQIRIMEIDGVWVVCVWTFQARGNGGQWIAGGDHWFETKDAAFEFASTS